MHFNINEESAGDRPYVPKPTVKTTPVKKKRRKGRGWRRAARVLIIVAGFLAILHIVLPYFILRYVNKKMANMPEYVGHIDKMRLNLFTGSVVIRDFTLEKKSGAVPVPFFSSNRIKTSIQWGALFKGRIVAVVEVDTFALNFVKGPTKAQTQTTIDKSWIDLFDELIPITINRFVVNSGQVHFRDYHQNPKVDVFLSSIYVLGENLGNVNDSNVMLPGKVIMTANAYGGVVRAGVKLDPMSRIPAFDANIELKRLPLTYLNDFIRAYANFDVQEGYFSLYAEAASRKGLLTGYVKPFLEDLNVLDLKAEKEDPAGRKIYEALIEVGAWILKNKKEDQVATRIDIEGSLTKPDISPWQAIGQTIGNAFIKALMQDLENSVNIKTVGKKNKRGFWESIFGKKDKTQKENKKKKNK